ncbi:EAL domain-containing protein [Virgisporangium ochraceum]|nr:EAL domain-containing protein [Virgisporangium ochraceum]
MARRSGWLLWSREGYDGRVNEPQTPESPGPAGNGSRGVTAIAAADPHHRSRPAHRGDTLVDQIITDRAVDVEFQAVVDSRRDQIVAFEALARGPEGPLRSPLQLFNAARAVDRLGELDWVCRAEAFRRMLAADLPPAMSLFVNIEADSLIEPCPDDLLPVMKSAEDRLRVFVDLTGQALSRYPCQVLETVRRARAAGWGIAVTDVAYSSAGLTLLPVIEPDVIKVDQRILTNRVGQTAEAILASLAESEHTGAALLMERVESREDAMTARAFGATYKQGRLLGREGPLPTTGTVPTAPLPLLRTHEIDVPRTPFEVLLDGGAHQTSGVTPEAMGQLIQTIASQACASQRAPVVAAITPAGSAIDAATEAMWRMLLERCPLVVVLGPDVSRWNDWRVRAADVPEGHPFGREHCFLALSPSSAMAVAARPHPGANPRDPTWDLAVSQQQSLCRDVLRHLLATVDTLDGGVHHGPRGAS